MNGYSYHAKLPPSAKLNCLASHNLPSTYTLKVCLSFGVRLNFLFSLLLLAGALLISGRASALTAIDCVESLPIANSDSVAVCPPTEGVSINVLANDLPTEAPIQGIYQIFFTPANVGTLSVSPDSLSLIYSVNSAFSGQDVFQYQIWDVNGLVSAPATLVITGFCDDNSGFIAGVAFSDTDADGSQNPGEPGLQGISVQLYNSTGTLLQTLATDADGYYVFSALPDGQYLVQVPGWTVPAGLSLTTPAQYEITISGGGSFVFADFGFAACSGGNLPPDFSDIYLCSNPISPITICIGSTDAQGDPVSITEVHSLFDCGITILNDTCIQYIALPAFFGIDTLHIEVCDQHINTCSGGGSSSLCSTVNAIITVPCPNAQNDVVSTPLNTAIAVNVLANDAGVPPLAVSVIGQPSNGNAATVGNQVLYTPNTGFTGTDTITYQITDPNGNTDAALVIVYVIPVGELPPSAQNDNIPCPFSVSADGTLTPEQVLLPVLNNDTDPNANLSGIVAVGNPIYGAASVVSGNSILYIPSSAYLFGSITDEFYYVVADATGLTDTAWITISCSLTPATACVTAYPNFTSIPAGGSAALNVLANDVYCATCSPTPSACIPITSSPLITTITIPNPPANGTVTVVNNGTEDTGLTYVPYPGFSGTDTFTYVVCTNNGLCDSAPVTITVLPPASEQQITANNDIVATPQNTALIINLLTNDQLCLPPLPCLPPLSTGQLMDISIVEPAENGTIAINSFSGSDISVTYTPNPGFTGVDVFDYLVCSTAQGLCDTATVTVYVTAGATNNPPVANNDFHLLTINTPVTSHALDNDFDPDGDPLTIVAITNAPNNGTATISADGQTILYLPNTNFTGNDTLTYQISDGELTATALIIFFVEGAAPGNNPPVAVDDFVSTPPATPLTIAVLSNDYDPDGDVLSVTTIFETPLNGTAIINTDGIVIYTPNTGFTGTDTFTYIISDGALTDAGQVVVFVEGVIPENSPPVANPDVAATEPGIPVTIPVLNNDTDPNGDTVSIVAIDTPPGNGFVFINADGTITYNPDPGFTGTDTFSYQITDGELTDIGVVVVTVEELPNQPPVAVTDTVSTAPTTPVNIEVLLNDYDPEGNTVSVVTTVTPPANGIAYLNPDSTITYIPNPGFTGTDTFTYEITDGLLTDLGTVIVTVGGGPVNQPPIANNDFVSPPPNTPVTIAVLNNDTDPDGDTISIVAIDTPPGHGFVFINPDGTVTYNPDPGYTGPDTFSYQITDGQLTDIGVVIINVQEPANQPPVAVDDAATTNADTPVIIPVLDNDTDPNGDPLAITDTPVLPSNGTILLNPDGTVTYLPNTGFSGTDTFSYVISDGELTDTAQVIVTVNDTINDAPVAVDDAATTDAGTPIDIPVLDNDTDPNGATLTVIAIADDPQNGTALINPEGTITYTPDTGFIGIDTFVYVIS
ncbi:hypothetical protein C7N43_08610, partial [Sphingobacteriales bacterium UPWRP_1]